MKNYLLGFFVFVFLAGILNAGDIVKKSGTFYRNAEIELATGRDLLIMHGTCTDVIPSSNLTDDLQKKTPDRRGAVQDGACCGKDGCPYLSREYSRCNIRNRSSNENQEILATRVVEKSS